MCPTTAAINGSEKPQENGSRRATVKTKKPPKKARKPEPHLFRRVIRHLCSCIAPPHRAGSERPPLRQRLPLPYLRARILGQCSVKVGRENVVPARCVPQLPGDRVEAWTRAPRKLLG